MEFLDGLGELELPSINSFVWFIYLIPVLLLLGVIFKFLYKKVDINEALVVSSGWGKYKGTRSSLYVVTGRITPIFFWQPVTRASLEAFHVDIPFDEVLMRTSVDPSAIGGSATGLIKVSFDVRASIRPISDEDSIVQLTRTFGDFSKDNKEAIDVIEGAIQAAIREIMTKFSADDIVENDDLRPEAAKLAADQLADFGLTVSNIVIKNIRSPENYFDLKRQISDKERRIAILEAEQREAEKKNAVMRQIKIEEQETQNNAIEAERKTQLMEEARLREVELARAIRERDVAEQKKETDREIAEAGKAGELKRAELDVQISDFAYQKAENVGKARGSEHLEEQLRIADAAETLLKSQAAGENALVEAYQKYDLRATQLKALVAAPELLEKALGKDGIQAVMRAVSEPISKVESISIVDVGGDGRERIGGLTGIANSSADALVKVLATLKGLGLDDLIRKAGLIEEKKEPDGASEASTIAEDTEELASEPDPDHKPEEGLEPTASPPGEERENDPEVTGFDPVKHDDAPESGKDDSPERT